jgi:hypothetical protein
VHLRTTFMPSNHHKFTTIYHPKTRVKTQNPLQKHYFTVAKKFVQTTPQNHSWFLSGFLAK